MWTRTLHKRFCFRAPLSRRLRLRASDFSFRLGEEQQVPATRRPPPAAGSPILTPLPGSRVEARHRTAPAVATPLVITPLLLTPLRSSKPRPLWARVGATPLMATPLAALVPGSSYMLPRAVVSLLSSWPCPSPTHPGRGLCSFPKVGDDRRA